MAKAIAVFESNVRNAVPQERKDCSWAKSNFHQPDLSPFLTQLYNHCSEANDFSRLYNWIDSIDSEEDLAGVISPRRGLSWNFQNILGSCGTVEFRRPPQVIGTRSTCHWIAFGLSLWSYALSCNFKDLTSALEHDDFAACIRRGARNLGVESALSDWDLMSQTIQISELSLEDIARITERKRQKRSLFVEKVCASFWNVLNRLISTDIKCSL